jgi:peptidoglycan hydrolase CwlO-like protein
MRKIIILLLFLGAVVSSVIGITKYNEYKNKPKEKNTTEELEKEIKKVEEEIKNKEEELEKVKEENKPILEEIEKWQKKIEDIEKHFG